MKQTCHGLPVSSTMMTMLEALLEELLKHHTVAKQNCSVSAFAGRSLAGLIAQAVLKDASIANAPASSVNLDAEEGGDVIWWMACFDDWMLQS